jgi:hypothetical protein
MKTKKRMEVKKHQISRWLIAVSIIAISTLIFSVCMFSGRSNKDAVKHTHSELQNRYDYLLTHVVINNVHPLLRPVHFSIGDKFAAAGTLVLKPDLTPYEIITAAHLFSETQPGSDYYDYHVLGHNGFTQNGHLSRVVLDSIRSSDTPEGIQDIAVCYIGEPGLISRTSKVMVSAEVPFKSDYTILRIDPIEVTSITTGEKYVIPGLLVNTAKVPLSVMLYENVNGESGSGFWGNDGRLYVLSGSIMVNEKLRKELKIPENFRYVTVCSGVNIKW